ncbi:RNA-directed DNA polymerase from mobile element jockey [Araneus ventricosus]|uniref:RNA-directed DNA polymerase from mobile element jockey n=1 Tax=Araneus ventricosus TaxID=182803 RepID=A0A4Y2QH80_ARAVE|nr:RNA-directed DNA polymerase from mobile element jockey [Araneus ventricosus]
MSSRGDQRAAELKTGLCDLSFLYDLKNGPERDVVDFCMKMDVIAKKTKNISSLNGSAGIDNIDLEKANFLAESLETQFTLNNITNPDTEELVAYSVMRFRTEVTSICKDFDSPPTSEVLDCIKSLRINKAPGIDGINNKMIKNPPLHTILTILTIIHKIMTLGHFPTRWKTATVVPILKSGKDPTDTISYRPIFLLPSLSKIAEHLILKGLNNYLKENNVLCPEQFGFLEKLSTWHQLIRVVEYVTEGFANKQKTGAVFLDIQKGWTGSGKMDLSINVNTTRPPPTLLS